MCRLLGVMANKPVDLEFSLLKADIPFRNFGNSNPDGWGIGWYENNEAKIYKESISAVNEESTITTHAKEVKSNIIICHVRRKTKRGSAERNSHPFKYDKNWLFAHNGSVDKDYLYSLLKDTYKSKIIGEADSEVYFHYIMQCIEECGDIINGIKEAICKTTQASYSGLNFLLSNGNSLYAFRYAKNSQDYYTLYKLERTSFKRVPDEVKSKETGALLRSKMLTGEKAVLICSEKLTEEKWQEIGNGNLLIIELGLKTREVKILQ